MTPSGCGGGSGAVARASASIPAPANRPKATSAPPRTRLRAFSGAAMSADPGGNRLPPARQQDAADRGCGDEAGAGDEQCLVGTAHRPAAAARGADARGDHDDGGEALALAARTP